MSAAAGPRRTLAAPAALAAVTAAALALRLAFRIDHDEDIDGLRFALGVERFDVAALRPHAPYYPVFVAIAKLVTLAGASPRGALGVVSAIAGAATVTFTALLAREVAGRRAAAFAAVLALCSPALWLASEKLLSDMAGVAVFTAALWLCARARAGRGQAAGARTAALVLLGVGLGVRLSYFPIAAACLVVIAWTEGGAAWATRTRDLLAGVIAWLAPLVIVAPPRDLVATTWVQAVGHFTRWGGSAITVPSPAARLSGAAWGLWANMLGGAWPDAPAARWLVAPVLAVLLIAACRVAARRAAPRAQPELWSAGALYLAWALLGQNIAHKPRHLLPLAPILVVALAAGAAALLPRGRGAAARSAALTPLVLVAALGGAWFVDGLALARAHRAPSPAAALVAFLRDDGGDTRPIFTRDLARMIAEGAPGRRAVAVAGDAALVDAVARAGPDGALITSEALSSAARSALAARGYALRTRFARPRSRYVDALWSELALVEARSPTSLESQ